MACLELDIHGNIRKGLQSALESDALASVRCGCLGVPPPNGGNGRVFCDDIACFRSFS